MNQGKFAGNLTDMCEQLCLNPQSKNKTALKEAIEALEAQGFLSWSKKGNIFQIACIPKGEEIAAPEGLVQAIVKHDYCAAVAPEQVLRVYLWICKYGGNNITNADIQVTLALSESTVCEAKKILEKDFNAILRDLKHAVQDDGTIRCTGQELIANAWWNNS